MSLVTSPADPFISLFLALITAAAGSCCNELIQIQISGRWRPTPRRNSVQLPVALSRCRNCILSALLSSVLSLAVICLFPATGLLRWAGTTSMSLYRWGMWLVGLRLRPLRFRGKKEMERKKEINCVLV